MEWWEWLFLTVIVAIASRANITIMVRRQECRHNQAICYP